MVIKPQAGESDLGLVARCGGYYEVRKDACGRRLTPLVGYAGRDPTGKQFVGDAYVNFARAERHPSVLGHFAVNLASKLSREELRIDAYCGLPLGGIALSQALAMVWDVEAIFLEKEVLAIKTAESREQSRLVIGRHEVEKGQGILLVEDVCNNFSTTDQAITCIHEAGGVVVGVACFLNRSLTVDTEYRFSGGSIPVIALVRRPMMEYRQGDCEVAEDIARGNVVWKPKSREGWKQLQDAIATHETQTTVR